MRYILVFVLFIIGLSASCLNYEKYEFSYRDYTYSLWVPENMRLDWRYREDCNMALLIWHDSIGSGNHVVITLHTIFSGFTDHWLNEPEDTTTQVGYRRTYDNRLVHICGIAGKEQKDIFDSIFNSITVCRATDSNRVSLHGKYAANYTTTRIKFALKR